MGSNRMGARMDGLNSLDVCINLVFLSGYGLHLPSLSEDVKEAVIVIKKKKEKLIKKRRHNQKVILQESKKEGE